MLTGKQIKLSVAALAGAAALVLCIIMSLHSISGSALVGCGTGSACDSVLGGRWATLFGIFPVSGIAAGIYLAFLLSLGVVLFSKDPGLKDTVSKVLIVLSGAIIGAAVWFICLQLFAEKALCKYCISAHALGILCAVMTLSALIKDTVAWGKWLGAGVGLAALLAVLQALTAPDSIYQDGSSEEPFPMIAQDEAPLVGSPDAEFVIDLLYDYQCSHCRVVHGLLPEVVDLFEGRVAFVLCPCPLSPKCNPYVPKEETRFEGSCELARLALAVHRLEPDAFEALDGWLFEAEGSGVWRPRTVEAARGRAAGLVGQERLEAFLPEPALSETLRRSADLFGRTATRGDGAVPRFVYGDRWVVPSADSAEELAKILAERFGIR